MMNPIAESEDRSLGQPIGVLNTITMTLASNARKRKAREIAFLSYREKPPKSRELIKR